ncbi:MAG: class I SAM-dependent methyltransferase [Chryseolinea sp.]
MSWSGFWQNQRNAFTPIMQINTAYFADQIKKSYTLNPSVNILDYGCGPGLLIDSLGSRNVNCTGVDINAYFVDECKEKHPSSDFFQISTDIAATQLLFLTRIDNKKFDLVIMLSILQYFNSANDIESLLSFLKNYLTPSGKIILADVVSDANSPFRDTWSLLKQSLLRGKIVAFVRFILYLIFSPYRKISDQQKLLVLSEKTIADLANKVGLRMNIVQGMTIHPSRTNYVLTLH